MRCLLFFSAVVIFAFAKRRQETASLLFWDSFSHILLEVRAVWWYNLKIGMNRGGQTMKFLQKLGKAIMLPVMCLPLCGILMGIGYLLCPASMQGN